MSTPPRPLWLYPLVVVALGMAIWSPTVVDAFRSDDYVTVHGVAAPAAALLSGSEKAGADWYRPLNLLSFALDRALWGAVPYGFHITNILLFGLGLALVYGFVNAFSTRRDAALIAALIVAVHGSSVGYVGWISGRPELLMSAFALGALWTFTRSGDEAGFRPIPFAASSVLYFAAIMSKESAFLLILPAAVILWFRRQDDARIPRWTFAVWVVVAAVAVALRARTDAAPVAFGFGWHVLRSAIRYVQGFALPFEPVTLLSWFFRTEYLLLPILAAVLAAALYLLRRAFLTPLAVLGGMLAFSAFWSMGAAYPEPSHALLITIGGAMVVAALVVGVGDRSEKTRRSALAVLSIWIVVLFASSVWGVVKSKTASSAARSVVDQCLTLLDSTPGTKRLVALTVPDAYRGVYVMRNGLHQAIRLARPESDVTAHQVLLFGMNENPDAGLRVRREDSTRFLVWLDPDHPGYLLLPDGIRSRHKDEQINMGPVLYRIVREDIPFRPSEIELVVDPQFLTRDPTLLVSYDAGRMRAPTIGGDASVAATSP